MKNIFVDTNIIIDLIADREPFSKYAIALFSEAEKKKVKLYTSSHAIATTHYLLKKYTEEKKLRQILLELSTYLQIIPIDADIIRKGLKSKYKDFEDALQILLELSTYLQIIPIDADMIKKGLKSKHKDFEDALQILCAGSIPKIDCIITRNTKDFKQSDIPVISPDQLKL